MIPVRTVLMPVPVQLSRAILWLLFAMVLLPALAVAALPGPHTVLANGTPVKVILTYQPGLSNWGPQTASGIAEIVFGEGEVRLLATGLPQLQGERYTIWLMRSDSGEALALAQGEADRNSGVRIDTVLNDSIPEKGWDVVLLTVEPAGVLPPSPGPRHSIAGYVPREGSGGGGGELPRPRELPRTGGDAPITTALPSVPLPQPAGTGAQAAAAPVATERSGIRLWSVASAISLAVGLGLGYGVVRTRR
jgi:hypothetical protein